jgi:hypothetical protein
VSEGDPSDEELVKRLRALYDAAEYSGGARDDFWDLVSTYTGRIIELAVKGAKLRGRSKSGVIGGRARAESLSPERRKQIAQNAANARWASR